MKRYLLFVCPIYYPGGGWKDFDGDYDTIDGARASALAKEPDYCKWHIVDTDTGVIIEDGRIQPY